MYERRGVYEVESVGAPPMPTEDGCDYYKLRSAFSGSKEIIYIPVDEQYLKLVERLVCEEFAAVLRTTPDAAKKWLYAAMRRKTSSARKVALRTAIL